MLRRERFDETSAESNFGLLVEQGGLFFEPVRERDVVGVHARDEWRGAEIESGVERGDKPIMLSCGNFEARVVRSEAGGDVHRVVRRAVIHDDALPVAERLCRDRVESAGEEIRAVPHGQQNADGRFFHDRNLYHPRGAKSKEEY